MSESIIVNPDETYFAKAEEQALLDGRQLCVDLIIRKEGAIFLQKRSADRRLYPNCWEVPGGHVEEGESVLIAITRELKEETGLDLTRITHVIGLFDWEVKPEWQKAGDNPLKRSLQLVVEATGEVVLEFPKVTEGRYVSHTELPGIAADNAQYKDAYVVDLCEKVFAEI